MTLKFGKINKFSMRWLILLAIVPLIFFSGCTSQPGIILSAPSGNQTIFLTHVNTTVFAWNGTALSDLNMSMYSIINATWVNTTNINVSQICFNGTCLLSWPINSSAQIIAVINNSGYYNITAAIASYINNATERNLFTATYNITYNTWAYNQTSPAVSYIDWLILVFNSTWNSTYNVTYDTWAYNQTTPAVNYVDWIVDTFNSTWNTTYNSTYDTWAYNQTTPAVSYTNWIVDIFNATWNTTYNSTYDQWTYNQTLPAITYANSQFINMSNATVNQWLYNQTTPAIDWVIAQGYISQESEYNSNPLGYINDTSWNITAWNGTLAFNNTLSTYDTWAYNQTTPAIDWVIAQGYTGNASWNQSLADTLYYSILNPNNFINSSYNATYDTWSYNQTTPAIDWVTAQNYTTSNFTWNQSLADTLYYWITNPDNFVNNTYNSTYDTWAYNQTTPAIDYILSNPYGWLNTSYNSTYNTYAYNQTQPAIDWVIAQGYISQESEYNSNPLGYINDTSWNISAWNGTLAFNDTLATYDTWAYNQTLPAIDYANSQFINMTNQTWVTAITNPLYYNMTNNTFNYMANTSLQTIENQTVNQWLYNQTTPAIDWVTAQNYTTSNFTWNQSLADTLYYWITNPDNFINTTYNSTYDTYAYNQTTPAIDYILSNPYGWLNTSYNSTYDTYAYNQTQPAIDWVTAQGYISQESEYNSNPLGYINDTSWNITAWNGTLAFNNTLATYDTWAYNQTQPAIDWVTAQGYSVGNSSWNQSLTDTLYYSISNPYGFLNSSYNSTYNTWAYNQTTPAIDYILSNPYNWINTTAVDTEPLWSGNYSLYNDTWSSTYNSTYDTYAYNQTIEAIDYILSNPYNWVNTTYNSTYDQWAYNQTTAAIDYILSNPYGWLNSTYNTTYDTWAYNQTTSAIDYILSNPYNWVNSTYNSTYNTWAYNQTIAAIDYILSNPYNWVNTTYNSTYDTWAYNQTLPAITYANSQFINMTNTSWALTQAAANAQFINMSNATINQWLYNQTTPAITYADSLLVTTFYNASEIKAIRGIAIGTIGNITAYDWKSVNVTEEAGATGIDFRINFTNVNSLNQIVLRYHSTSGESHTSDLQLWDYTEDGWESYANFGNVVNFQIYTIGVFDNSSHIGTDGNVTMRFVSTANGNTGHVHYFDWTTISKGIAIPSSTEVDPWSVYRDGSTPLTDNWNAGNFNITASWFFGMMNGTNITGLTNSSLKSDFTILWGNVTDKVIYNATYEYQQNATLNQWLYNQTLSAINYANSKFINMTNQTWVTVITNPYYINMTNQTWVTVITNPYYINMSNATVNQYLVNQTILAWTYGNTFYQNMTNQSWVTAITNPYYINMSNATVNQYLYNQTLPAITYANSQFVNMSNATLNQYLVNQTILAWTYGNTFRQNMTNQTWVTAITNPYYINMTNTSWAVLAGNSTLQLTTNNTWAVLVSNSTLQLTTNNTWAVLASNSTLQLTTNTTLQQWLYNQTLPAITYANSQFINMTNTSWALTQAAANTQFYNMTNNTFNYMINQTLQTTLNNTWAVLAGNSTLQLTTNNTWAVLAGNSTLQLTTNSSWAVLAGNSTLQLTTNNTWAVLAGNSTLQLITNTTLQQWLYNQTTPAINYANSKFINMTNTSWAVLSSNSTLQLTTNNTWAVLAGNSTLQLTTNNTWVTKITNPYYINMTNSSIVTNLATVTGWINSSTMNASTKIISPTHCFTELCTKNITFNGTNIIIYG